MNTNNISFFSLFVIVFYVLIQVISNISSSKIANVFGFAVDGGTFLYPLAFTLRDLVHKRFGKQIALKLIVVSVIVNIFTPFYFLFLAHIKPFETWVYNEDFFNILIPTIRIFIASIIGGFRAEILDTEVYHIFVTKITKRFQWLRVLLSNLISIPFDTLMFTIIAFFGLFSYDTLLDIFVFNFAIKYVVSIFSVPLIYLVKEKNKVL